MLEVPISDFDVISLEKKSAITINNSTVEISERKFNSLLYFGKELGFIKQLYAFLRNWGYGYLHSQLNV